MDVNKRNIFITLLNNSLYQLNFKVYYEQVTMESA